MYHMNSMTMGADPELDPLEENTDASIAASDRGIEKAAIKAAGGSNTPMAIPKWFWVAAVVAVGLVFFSKRK